MALLGMFHGDVLDRIEGAATPRLLHGRSRFRHLVLTKENLAYRQALARLQGRHRIHVAGMYVTDVDTHESAVHSAADVARRLAPSSSRLMAWDVATAQGRVPRRASVEPLRPRGRRGSLAA